jgi:hypothetical protein
MEGIYPLPEGTRFLPNIFIKTNKKEHRSCSGCSSELYLIDERGISLFVHLCRPVLILSDV